MIRRWCVALALAVALGAVGIVVRDASSSGWDARRELQRGSASSLTVSLRDWQVDLVLPPRRVASEGSTKPVLQASATLSAACALALFGTLCGRQWAPCTVTRSALRVPCGLRAPPALRFA